MPITRPIRVDCHADRLTIVVASSPAGGKEILIRTITEGAIDAFVTSVREVIADWGIAGRGMYWRPVLSVRVAPDAEQRFAELETLLHGSGLEVRRVEG